jgi:hypothetical protein
MSEARKQIRVTLPASTILEFEDAKARAEDAAMMKMTDTQYATRLMQWALEQRSDHRAAVVVQYSDDGKFILDIIGNAGTKANEYAHEVLRQWLKVNTEKRIERELIEAIEK